MWRGVWPMRGAVAVLFGAAAVLGCESEADDGVVSGETGGQAGTVSSGGSSGGGPGSGGAGGSGGSTSGGGTGGGVDGGSGGGGGTGGASGQAGAGGTSSEQCAGKVDGTYCGADVTPRGEDIDRYFCRGGELLGLAACSYACGPPTGVCTDPGGGPTSGDPTGNFANGEDCAACLEGACLDERSECGTQNACASLLLCASGCADAACVELCRALYAEGRALFDPLRSCLVSLCTGSCQSA